MGKDWQDCIVTLIDLVGVRAKAPQGIASALMRKFHNVVVKERGSLNATASAYVWNDSVLLLSYVNDNSSSFEGAMKDADKLKRRVDTVERSYAIAVKGQTFPPVNDPATHMKSPSITVIRASSWAMANVFEIEKKLGKLKKSWYVDGWIKNRISTSQRFQKESMTMFPLKQKRPIYVFEDYLWAQE
jgi:hypothetical protein